MRVLKAFEFKRGNTIIHKLDPRVKFLLSTFYIFVAFLFNNVIILLTFFLSLLPLFHISRTLSNYIKSLRGAIIFIIFIFILNYFTSGVETASIITLRLILLMSSFSIFFLTTYPEDFAIALVKIGVPYDFALTFTMALRFVPTLAREAQLIIDAQRSRGLELEKGSFITKLRNYIPILVPLIVNALRRSISIAEAMESRAFGASSRRGSFIELSFKRSDYLLLLIILFLISSSIILKFYVHVENYLTIYPS
ncbi:MAG: energy-coupling factor transporter transmembrane protein EcfT [Candidatus Methanomethylicia archaeon]|nr:energy-coupling factor transporter transmembrane protein EcfT [Candidatus Methanomethylicia archaeon]MCX8169029.1 energy-coupling factor transporter transmembrane protein EcfT [Candidatus Methanomethylicia archaeon]MDW7988761.1 energy-coupling factor transporter transmembrane component T [Nitrososphaerota archaeon]